MTATMNRIDHVHAAIISLTKYESAQHHGDIDSACWHMFETMQHVIAIAKQTPAEPWSKPSCMGRPERDARYIRATSYLIDMLPIQDTDRFLANRIGLVWYECIALCEHHGWVLLAQAATQGQYIPKRQMLQQDLPLLSQVAAPARR